MAVCYFNGNYENKYRCKYVVEANTVNVEVEYDIGQEVEYIKGVRSWPPKKPIEDRDILILDPEESTYILLKKAYFTGKISRIGSFDDRDVSKFESRYFLKSAQAANLMDLPATPKVKEIRIYSVAVAEYIGHPSVVIEYSEDEYAFKLKRNKAGINIDIESEDIKNIFIEDEWSSKVAPHSISIEMGGYIGLELKICTNYTDIYDYIFEVMIYMQLFLPGKFKIEKIEVEIDNKKFLFGIPIQEIKYVDRSINPSVKEDLSVFLKRCYEKIPYRNSKDEIRNIAYVVMNTSRNLEDNFLTFYRFIECYYKGKGVKRFMTECMRTHYAKRDSFSDDQLAIKAKEMISLRNRYVHAGYYIENSNLIISFGKENREPKNYSVKADFEWIYARTKDLYLMVIDIIFRDMLGIEEYKFEKNF